MHSESITTGVVSGAKRASESPAALGLAIFGIYGLCEARWRKV
jgi:hypothetical protein